MLVVHAMRLRACVHVRVHYWTWRVHYWTWRVHYWTWRVHHIAMYLTRMKQAAHSTEHHGTQHSIGHRMSGFRRQLLLLYRTRWVRRGCSVSRITTFLANWRLIDVMPNKTPPSWEGTPCALSSSLSPWIALQRGRAHALKCTPFGIHGDIACPSSFDVNLRLSSKNEIKGGLFVLVWFFSWVVRNGCPKC